MKRMHLKIKMGHVIIYIYQYNKLALVTQNKINTSDNIQVGCDCIGLQLT